MLQISQLMFLLTVYFAASPLHGWFFLFLFFFNLNQYISSNCSYCVLLQVLIRKVSLISWRANDITCNLFPCYGIVKCEVSVHQSALKYHSCILRNSSYQLPYATFVPSLSFKIPLGALSISSRAGM